MTVKDKATSTKKVFDEAKILRKALPYPAFDVSKKPKQTVFTTKPKTRRHLKGRISGNRARAFMEHLWRKKFTECHYKALRIQFIQYFESNDPRIITKYIGRPKFVANYYRESVKKNPLSGTVRKVQSRERRTLEAKSGLMEVLGYLSLDKKTGSCKIHHELMPYFTKQTTLKDMESKVDFSRPFLPQKNDYVSQKISKDNLCVSLGAEASKQQNSSTCTEMEKKKKEEEEEYNSTHKSSIQRVKPLPNTKWNGGELSSNPEKDRENRLSKSLSNMGSAKLGSAKLGSAKLDLEALDQKIRLAQFLDKLEKVKS